MRAILINAKEKTIKEVELEKPTLQSMYKLIDCELVDCVRLDDQNDLWVDDEGLNKEPEHFFEFTGTHQPFAGNGLIASHTDSGETVGTDMPFEKVKESVRFFRGRHL
jgi:hypothetical protein